MRITFTVTAEIDPTYIERQVLKLLRSETFEEIIESRIKDRIRIDCDNALADALMYKDGIVAGSVSVQKVDE